MEKQVGHTHVADYIFIEAGLKARWAPFCDLEEERKNFTPKTIADFAEDRERELIRLQRVNPAASQESLLSFIDKQINERAKPETQIWLNFHDRIRAEYITVALLSHALTEAAINAILAIGLASSDAEDLFELLERAEVNKKWLSGPKAFQPAYTFPKSGALYETLQHLTRQRNSLVHYKVELSIGGEKKLDGSRLDREPIDIQLSWIRRFFSLPYDLAAHVRSQLASDAAQYILFDSSPIELAKVHATT